MESITFVSNVSLFFPLSLIENIVLSLLAKNVIIKSLFFTLSQASLTRFLQQLPLNYAM